MFGERDHAQKEKKKDGILDKQSMSRGPNLSCMSRLFKKEELYMSTTPFLIFRVKR